MINRILCSVEQAVRLHVDSSAFNHSCLGLRLKVWIYRNAEFHLVLIEQVVCSLRWNFEPAPIVKFESRYTTGQTISTTLRSNRLSQTYAGNCLAETGSCFLCSDRQWWCWCGRCGCTPPFASFLRESSG